MKVKPVEKGKIKNALRGPRMLKKMKTPAKKVLGVARASTQVIGDLKKNSIKKKSVRKLPKPGRKGNLKLKKLDVAEDTVKQAVTILMGLYDEHKSEAKATLLNDKDTVFLQLVLMKKPEVPEQRRKFVTLPHGVFGGDPEVCLFVKNYIPYDKIERTPDEKIELTVEHYANILKWHGVETITTIMPLLQLRTEYDSYELKRKLVDKFDVFICQSTLLEEDNFLKNVGIAFTKRNKVPIPVKFPHNLLKRDPKFSGQVISVINSSWYTLKPHSDTISLRVGNVSQTQEQLVENVEHVLTQLTEISDEAVPGGVPNIKSVMLKTSRSKALPLYLNVAPKKLVAVPVVKSVRGAGKAEEGELTTQLGKKVVVMPNGDVFVVDDPNYKPPPGWDSDQEDDIDDDDDVDEQNQDDLSDEHDPPTTKKRKITKSQKNKNPKKAALNLEESDSDDSEAGEAEVAEKKYLKLMGKHVVAEKPRQRPQKKAAQGGKAKTAAKKEEPQKVKPAAKKEEPKKAKAVAKKEEPKKAKAVTKKEGPVKAKPAAKKEEPLKAKKTGKATNEKKALRPIKSPVKITKTFKKNVQPQNQSKVQKKK